MIELHSAANPQCTCNLCSLGNPCFYRFFLDAALKLRVIAKVECGKQLLLVGIIANSVPDWSSPISRKRWPHSVAEVCL
jgi:hypothetical protein